MLLFMRIKTRFKLGLIALFGCVFCVQSYADDHDRVNELENFGNDEYDGHKLFILPIRMMDDETLFKAAEAERDNSMSFTQRVFNNRWLMPNEKSNPGKDLLRRYLQEAVLNYLNRNKTRTQVEVNLQGLHAQEESQFAELSRYRLRVSDDQIRLQFKFQFD